MYGQFVIPVGIVRKIEPSNETKNLYATYTVQVRIIHDKYILWD